MNHQSPAGNESVNTDPASSDHPEIVARLQEARLQLKREIGRVVIGQEKVIDSLLVAMLCRGHALMIGVPGLGKTLIARSLAKMLAMQYSRIQFTPDLMPSDITGSDIIEEDPQTGRRQLEFFRGPLFTNFLLADEINRAPPKTQAALLQAMQEREISVGRETYRLPPPFFVVATQNPVEQEGTYPLPEAQLDRFMFNIPVVYPSKREEAEIVKATTGDADVQLESVLSLEEVLKLQSLVRGVPVANHVIDYAVDLVDASRPNSDSAASPIHRFIRYGASPRATQCLVLGGKARAVLMGRYHVDFEDIRAVASAVMRHRLALNFQARTENVTVDHVISQLIQTVPIPS
ncbi:MAG: MoxR family ATPase [Planctomycetales bacterium]|nr:MoxR family ATPase [Planctomycetales bacterium]